MCLCCCFASRIVSLHLHAQSELATFLQGIILANRDEELCVPCHEAIDALIATGIDNGCAIFHTAGMVTLLITRLTGNTRGIHFEPALDSALGAYHASHTQQHKRE